MWAGRQIVSETALDHIPAHSRAGLAKMNEHKPLAQPEACQAVLTRYENGETIQQIATSLSITRAAVYRHLLRHAEDDWREYQAARAIDEYESARSDLKAAQDGVTVSRARELARLAWQEMSSLKRSLYGDKVEGSGNAAPTINFIFNGHTGSTEPRVIEGTTLNAKDNPESGNG